MSIEEQIDNAIRDYGVSPDAMRWTPDQAEEHATPPPSLGGIRVATGDLVVLDEAHAFRRGGGWGVADTAHGWSTAAGTAGDYALSSAANQDVSPAHFHIDLRAHAADPAQARRAVESAIENYMRRMRR